MRIEYESNANLQFFVIARQWQRHNEAIQNKNKYIDCFDFLRKSRNDWLVVDCYDFLKKSRNDGLYWIASGKAIAMTGYAKAMTQIITTIN